MGLLDGLLTGAGSALISGIGGALGATQSNANNIKAQNNQMIDNAQLMGIQNSYNTQNATTAFNRSQEQLSQVEQYDSGMANTAFQRQVADLKAAGLNPILGMGTSGASAPTVSASAPASPTVSSSGVGLPSMQSALGSGISSAAQGARLFSDFRKANADADTSEANAETQGNLADKTYWDAHSAQVAGQNAQKVVDANLAKVGADTDASTAAAQRDRALAVQAGGTATKTNGWSIAIPGLGGYDNKTQVTMPRSANVSPRVDAYRMPPRVITGDPAGGLTSLGPSTD